MGFWGGLWKGIKALGGFVARGFGWTSKQIQAPAVNLPREPKPLQVNPPPVVVNQPPVSGIVDELKHLRNTLVHELHQIRDTLATPEPKLPFDVVEPSQPGKINEKAFEHLVGMPDQQLRLEVVSSMMWHHWRKAESIMRMESRQRVALMLFTGPMGTGKTAHARALADFLGIPCILMNSKNATFVGSDGLSMMHRALAYASRCKSAVILLDEIDVYAKDEGVMAEIRMAVDGATKIEDNAILYIIGATNKGIDQFPPDLLHRVLMQVDFGGGPTYSPSRQGYGFNSAQCRNFWDRNAQCLAEDERKKLAEASQGCVPRDLQLWAQRVLLSFCRRAMEKGLNPDDMGKPSLRDFMEANPDNITGRKAAAILPCLDLSEHLREKVLEVTTFLPECPDGGHGRSHYSSDTGEVKLNGEPARKWLIVVTAIDPTGDEVVVSAYYEFRPKRMSWFARPQYRRVELVNQPTVPSSKL